MKENDKGRSADKPRDIPGAGWKEVMMRVKDQIATDNISIVAAGVAFYFFLALFPTLAAIISIYGLFTEPMEVERHMEQLTAVLPQSTQELLTDRLRSIAQQSDSTLGWSVFLGIILSLDPFRQAQVADDPRESNHQSTRKAAQNNAAQRDEHRDAV